MDSLSPQPDAYLNIAKTLDQAFRRAPHVNGDPSESFVEYLKIIYSEDEAELVQHISGYPNFQTAIQIADAYGGEVEEVELLLKKIYRKGCLLKFGNIYCLPVISILVNITSGYSVAKFDSRKAAELYEEFFVKEKFYRYYQMSEKGTPTLRTIPIEQTIAPGEKILKSEGAHEMINNLNHDDLLLTPCPCRSRKEEIGERECSGKYPVGFCIMLGVSALYFESIGLGKRVTKKEAIEYFDKMQNLGLVGTTDNAASGNAVICLCCGCCCSHLRGRTLWETKAVLPSNFVPVATDDCKYCGKCSRACFFGAITVDKKNRTFSVDNDKCLGCGICTLSCPDKTLKLHRFERSRMFKSLDSFYKTIARENNRKYL